MMQNQSSTTSRWPIIKSKLSELIPATQFNFFIEPLKVLELENENYQVKIIFDSSFEKEAFDVRFLTILQKAYSNSFGTKASEIITVVEQRSPALTLDCNDSLLMPPKKDQLRKTFDQFVVGSNNQFAHAACLAAADQPGSAYNPLLIFGGAGLGKTHLLQACYNKIRKNHTDLRIHMVSSEAFTNELVNAIRMDRMRDFREKYRTQCDVLLMDDIHFIAGKNRTQEEFFYTFNFLHENGRQIILTADKYPKEILNLEPRIQSRLEWGLVTDLQAPDHETRMSIVVKKHHELKLHLTTDVCEYIALTFVDNIRELEGAVQRLAAFQKMTHRTIELGLVHQLFEAKKKPRTVKVSKDVILEGVAIFYGVKTQDIRGAKRTLKNVIPRHVTMYLLRKHLLLSYPEIGQIIGGKDHSTVMHGVIKISKKILSDHELHRAISAIESQF